MKTQKITVMIPKEMHKAFFLWITGPSSIQALANYAGHGILLQYNIDHTHFELEPMKEPEVQAPPKLTYSDERVTPE